MTLVKQCLSNPSAPVTSVVNVKRDEFDVYIGRAMPGRKPSVFGNAFKIGEDGTRAEVISKYRQWLMTQPALLAELETLRGKRLGCWCKPLACHGDVLVELLEGPAIPAEPEPIQESLF